MDRLGQLLDASAPLLRRVDEVLSAAGAPPGHSVWPELRRVRLLPGDAVRAVAALRPADLADAARELHADAHTYADVAESLPPPGAWSGDAAGAYDDARRRAAGHLSGAPDSLDARLAGTAELADALAEWMEQARTDLAAMLAEVLGSTAAVTLSTDEPIDPAACPQVLAAAEIGQRVLRTIRERYDVVADLLHGSAQLAEASPAPPRSRS
ncbi:hypothetical protein EV385_3423 [Krasilnikovia cinnamomea]|uniref:Uncharacterized protein n=1 Tax=Krasilnikovia cinnamomea TaxID=349313 RepID=A0A4Q7ZMF5_9ACTN|nr:hypothetical protein [Krasilnikovia cinnamomea]RZU51593.1 hypothetical protein EV385_3423 [Krasilnikovia cinnamomea]